MTKDQIGLIASILGIVTGFGATAALLVQIYQSPATPDFIAVLYYFIGINLSLLIGASLLGLILHNKEILLRATVSDVMALKRAAKKH